MSIPSSVFSVQAELSSFVESSPEPSRLIYFPVREERSSPVQEDPHAILLAALAREIQDLRSALYMA